MSETPRAPPPRRKDNLIVYDMGEEFDTFESIEALLKGHREIIGLPGVDVSGLPLPTLLDPIVTITFYLPNLRHMIHPTSQQRRSEVIPLTII